MSFFWLLGGCEYTPVCLLSRPLGRFYFQPPLSATPIHRRGAGTQNKEGVRCQVSGASKTLTPDTSSPCDTSRTVTPRVAAAPRSRLFSGARVKNMGTEMIPGTVIVSVVVLSAAALVWAPEDWLRALEILARSLGRPI